MGNLKESLTGPGYVILNVVRALNIVVFLDMIAACIVMLVKINMQNGFFFFQAVTHAVVALISSRWCLDMTLGRGLTAYSLPYHFRAAHPPGLFQPQLAPIRRRFRLPCTCGNHDDLGGSHAGQPEH